MAYFKAAMALMFASGLMIYPGDCAAAARDAMNAWADSVAPALFPFAAVMPFLTCAEARHVYDRLLGPFVRSMFRLPGGAASAIITGFISGSPAGAMAAARVARAENLTKGQTARLAGIVCGVSPVYALSVMGVALNDSPSMGWRLVITQIFAQLMTGFIFSRVYTGEPCPVAGTSDDTGDMPVMAAVRAALRVCGYMVVFAVGIELAEKLTGDMILRISAFIDLPTGAPQCRTGIELAAALGFGGLCIGLQNLAVLKDMVKPWVYFAQKLTSALLCTMAYWSLGMISCEEMTLKTDVTKVNLEINVAFLMGIILPVLILFLRKRSKKLIS